MPKKIFKNILKLFLTATLVSGCASFERSSQGQKQTDKKRQVIQRQEIPDEIEYEPIQDADSPVPPEVIQVEPPKPPPKVGLILGAGGLRGLAHIGVLKEFQRAGLPIHAIVGMEWGALIGALYAHRGSANDLEWQLFKLKEEDLFEMGLLGKSKGLVSPSVMTPFLEKAFGDKKLEESAIPFSCPTKSTTNEILFWEDRGAAGEQVRKCLAFPPFFKPIGLRRAAVDAIEESVKHLQAQGADLIVFVNVLQAGKLFAGNVEDHQYYDSILWSWLKDIYRDRQGMVDEVVGVYVRDMALDQLSKRKQAVSAGQNAGRAAAAKLIEKYKF